LFGYGNDFYWIYRLPLPRHTARWGRHAAQPSKNLDLFIPLALWFHLEDKPGTICHRWIAAMDILLGDGIFRVAMTVERSDNVVGCMPRPNRTVLASSD
jgi:hypothetical protein